MVADGGNQIAVDPAGPYPRRLVGQPVDQGVDPAAALGTRNQDRLPNLVRKVGRAESVANQIEADHEADLIERQSWVLHKVDRTHLRSAEIGRFLGIEGEHDDVASELIPSGRQLPGYLEQHCHPRPVVVGPGEDPVPQHPHMVVMGSDQDGGVRARTPSRYLADEIGAPNGRYRLGVPFGSSGDQVEFAERLFDVGASQKASWGAWSSSGQLF